MSRQIFYNLFDEFESTCFGNIPQVTYTQEVPLVGASTLGEFVCINPLNGPRCDANVQTYRNILLEFDEGPLEDQIATIMNSGLPFTTLTYSGNKSMHVIISLETPCPDRASYDKLVSRIYSRFPNCDKSCKNPSRLSRNPDAYRADTNKKQSIEAVRSRVSAKELDAFLGPEPPLVLKLYKGPRLATKMHLNTMAFLQFGAPQGSWNINLFKAAADLCRCGLSNEEIIERLEGVSGYLDQKDHQTIQSAFRAVAKE